jgi:uncharacterized protein (DUF1778 family)
MNPSSPARKPLGVRATPEQHRLLTEAAARKHRSVSNFVLQAALEAAREDSSKPKRSRAEVKAILDAVREEFVQANAAGRDPLAELMAERREQAERG